MRLRETTERIERWDHRTHHITLSLVAASFLADILRSLLPDAGEFAEWLGHILHFAHYAALGLAVINIGLLLLFRRNIGGYIAKALSRSSPEPKSPVIEIPLTHFHYEALPISADDFQFVTEPGGELAKALFEINARSFEGSAFEMSHEDVIERNSSFIEKHGKVFMAVRNPLREMRQPDCATDDCIGFSCVLPLNAVGADCYLSGLIKDRYIRASMLCAEGEDCDTLLVFAIALKNEFRKVKGLAAVYYPFLLRCAEHHIKALASCHTGPSTVTVWVQAEHPQLRHHLEKRGFVWTGDRRSADGFELYHRSLEVLRPKSRQVRKKKLDTSP